MVKRSPLVVVLLAFCTFTLYAYYWLWRTTSELREETDRDDLSPALDVLLTVATLGLYGLYAAYRNAQIIHEELELRGEEHTDRSVPVAVFGVLSAVSGWSWLVSMALLQDDLNRLADTELDLGPAALEARFETGTSGGEDEAPVESGPRPQVFRSSAPMPVVY